MSVPVRLEEALLVGDKVALGAAVARAVSDDEYVLIGARHLYVRPVRLNLQQKT